MESKLSKFYWKNSPDKKQIGLTNWKINNFRSIGAGDNAQSLDLAPLTIICGENSSGKSTILNSILFLTQMFSDNVDDTHINQQGSLINLGEFMEIVNETDAGVLDEYRNESPNQEPDREWLKNQSDSFLQFSGSLSIPEDSWNKNSLNEFSPSQIHFEIALNSLLEDIYDLEELKKFNSEFDFQPPKSRDKSRLLRFNADFVSYSTQDSGYYAYYDLPHAMFIPDEDDVLELGNWSVDKISVVNRLVDFSKEKINYSNFENLKLEKDLKDKKYLFVSSEAERLFKASSPEYEIKIGSNYGYIDENYESFDSENLNELKLESVDFSHGNCIPVLNNGLPKQSKITTSRLELYLLELSKTILGTISFNSKSLDKLLDEYLGITISGDSYTPDTFWEDILSYNAEEVFQFLDTGIDYIGEKVNISNKELKSVNYWKWDTEPNKAILFLNSGLAEKEAEDKNINYSFLAVEDLVNPSSKKINNNELTSIFIEFICEHVFDFLESLEGFSVFKFRASASNDVPGSLFQNYRNNPNGDYEKVDYGNDDAKKSQAYFEDLLDFVNDHDDFQDAINYIILEFVIKHGINPNELNQIYNLLGSYNESSLVNNYSDVFAQQLAGHFKDLFIFSDEPLIVSTEYQKIDSQSADNTDEMRAIMMKKMADSFEKIKYIGPLRQLSIKEERNVNFHKNAPLGVNGEQFFNYFEKNKNNQIKTPVPIVKKNKINFEYETTSVKKAMDSWLSYFDIAKEFDTEADISLNILKGFVIPTNLDRKLRLDNLGVGFSQLAPIILLCITSTPGDTILLEQPELHLHPAVQQKFANFALEFAKKDVQIILETHSDHLVNRLRRELVESKDNLSDLISIFFVERKKGLSKFTLANVDKFGQYEFSKYPEGFFDQTAEDSLAILKARAKLKQDEQL